MCIVWVLKVDNQSAYILCIPIPSAYFSIYVPWFLWVTFLFMVFKVKGGLVLVDQSIKWWNSEMGRCYVMIEDDTRWKRKVERLCISFGCLIAYKKCMYFSKLNQLSQYFMNCTNSESWRIGDIWDNKTQKGQLPVGKVSEFWKTKEMEI